MGGRRSRRGYLAPVEVSGRRYPGGGVRTEGEESAGRHPGAPMTPPRVWTHRDLSLSGLWSAEHSVSCFLPALARVSCRPWHAFRAGTCFLPVLEQEQNFAPLHGIPQSLRRRPPWPTPSLPPSDARPLRPAAPRRLARGLSGVCSAEQSASLPVERRGRLQDHEARKQRNQEHVAAPIHTKDVAPMYSYFRSMPRGTKDHHNSGMRARFHLSAETEQLPP